MRTEIPRGGCFCVPFVVKSQDNGCRDFRARLQKFRLGGHRAHIVDLGTGVVPLEKAYEAARRAGAEYFIVDHDPPFHGQTALEAAKVDCDYVARLMAS